MEEFSGSAVIEVNACQYLYFFFKVILIGSHTNNIIQAKRTFIPDDKHV